MTDAARALARELADLRRRLDKMERSSQLSRSSVEIDGQAVTVPQGIRAAQSAAKDAAIALSTADGKNTVTYSPDEPDSDGTAEGDIWYRLDVGVVAGAWRWTGAEWEATQFGDAVLDSLTVGKLVSGEIAAGQKIIAGDSTGTHAEMSSTGFRVYATGPDGPDEVIRLGTSTDDYFAIVDEAGNLAAAIDQAGRASLKGVSVEAWPEIAAADHTGQGGSLLTILDRRGRGVLAYGASNSSVAVNTPEGRGTFEIAVRLHEGRLYRIHAVGRLNATTEDCLAEVQVRWTSGGLGSEAAAPTPSVSSAIIGRTQDAVPRFEGQGFTINKLFSLGPGESFRNARLLLSFSRIVGTGSITIYGPAPDGPEMWIEDVGSFTPNAQVVNYGVDGESAPPAPQRFSRSWPASWARSYRSNGAISSTDIYQGYGDSFNGAQRALIGFPAEIAAELAGATVEAVGLYLYAEHWWNNTGGIAVVGRHGYTAPPGSYPGTAIVEDMTQSPPNAAHGLWPKPGGRWLDLMPFAGQEWATGLTRGVVLGSGGMSTSPTYYGRFSPPGSGQQPVINITYRK